MEYVTIALRMGKLFLGSDVSALAG